MSYTPAQAEISKDAVLSQLQPSLDRVAEAGAQTVRNTIYHIVIGVFATILLLVVMILVFLLVMDFITMKTALLMGLLVILYLLVVAIVIIRSIEIYSRRKLNTISAIAFNFISSQRLLEIIDESAVVYLDNNL